MMRRKALRRAMLTLGAAGIAAGLALPASAAPGDVHAVTAEKANLRAAPSDDAAVRSTVTRGEEVVELRHDGAWIGIRVVRTGEEGWIFGDLVKRRTASTLSGGTTGTDTAEAAGFQRLSPRFDSLVSGLNQQFGYRFAETVEQGADGALRVVPTDAWVFNTSREAKIYAAVALYEMWKNYNNGRSVSVSLGQAGATAITVADGKDGPELNLPLVGSSR